MARVALIAILAVGLEWARVIAGRQPGAALPALILGGLALCLLGLGWPPGRLGLERNRLGLRILGGLALAAALLLPAAVRWQGGPVLSAPLAIAAITVSVGEEIAFRGALYAALDAVWGAPAAIVGSSLLFVAGHLLSHPTAFLVPVLAAGILLAAWRWACRDLVGPIVGHALADLAL